MALIANPLAAASAGVQKQIAVPAGAVASTVMYTVPTGRKFIGSFTPYGPTPIVYVNGVTIYIAAGTGVIQPAPVMLVAGTVITAFTGNNGCGLFGVESDA